MWFGLVVIFFLVFVVWFLIVWCFGRWCWWWYFWVGCIEICVGLWSSGIDMLLFIVVILGWRCYRILGLRLLIEFVGVWCLWYFGLVFGWILFWWLLLLGRCWWFGFVWMDVCRCCCCLLGFLVCYIWYLVLLVVWWYLLLVIILLLGLIGW